MRLATVKRILNHVPYLSGFLVIREMLHGVCSLIEVRVLT